mmetsp:Transcript_102865/g.291305  ORF Transcript_102865/g.291305 Transcript_102865/m.291305 type:complete len:315 (-) Transcript_102865:1655-2599(-)
MSSRSGLRSSPGLEEPEAPQRPASSPLTLWTRMASDVTRLAMRVKLFRPSLVRGLVGVSPPAGGDPDGDPVRAGDRLSRIGSAGVSTRASGGSSAGTPSTFGAAARSRPARARWPFNALSGFVGLLGGGPIGTCTGGGVACGMNTGTAFGVGAKATLGGSRGKERASFSGCAQLASRFRLTARGEIRGGDLGRGSASLSGCGAAGGRAACAVQRALGEAARGATVGAFAAGPLPCGVGVRDRALGAAPGSTDALLGARALLRGEPGSAEALLGVAAFFRGRPLHGSLMPRCASTSRSSPWSRTSALTFTTFAKN